MNFDASQSKCAQRREGGMMQCTLRIRLRIVEGIFFTRFIRGETWNARIRLRTLSWAWLVCFSLQLLFACSSPACSCLHAVVCGCLLCCVHPSSFDESFQGFCWQMAGSGWLIVGSCVCGCLCGYFPGFVCFFLGVCVCCGWWFVVGWCLTACFVQWWMADSDWFELMVVFVK